MGPTASGKTSLACGLVQHFPLEIVSVDSAMVYREMNIGTAKPDKLILKTAPHHLIDIRDPNQNYSAAHFCSDVSTHCQSITERGNYPLLVGGTMMYFRALQHGLSSLPSANEQLRSELLHSAQQYGWEFMHQELARVDPIAAARIHPHDKQRIQRALEVFHLSGKPLSQCLTSPVALNTASYINIILMPNDRVWLHQRIELRFQQMLEQGFLGEVEQLVEQWQLNGTSLSMRTVGYRQVLEYLNNCYDYNTMCAKAIAATRQLAKRQITWLRRWPNAVILDPKNPSVSDNLMDIVKKIVDNSA